MEIRRGKSTGKEITVREPNTVSTEKRDIKQVVEVQREKTKAEKAKGFLNDMITGFQKFADYAATTKAGSQDMDDVFGLPHIAASDDLFMGLPESSPRNKVSKKRRR